MASSQINIHASCVAIGRQGVLLIGPSGTGKSDLVLRLIDAGAQLVADDRTILWARNGALYAKAPKSIRGLLEVRGIGIVRLAVRAQVKIDLVVRLEREGARMPQKEFYRPPTPLKLTNMPLQISFNGHFASTPAKIRIALAAYSKKLHRQTFNPKSKGRCEISLPPARTFATVRRRSMEQT